MHCKIGTPAVALVLFSALSAVNTQSIRKYPNTRSIRKTLRR